jgi:integrase
LRSGGRARASRRRQGGGRFRVRFPDRAADRHADIYERVWTPLMGATRADGVAPFRIHNLRHTHFAWLIAGCLPLPNIQARLGHKSITTPTDT